MATDAEASVDELLDGIEQGTLVVAGVDGGAPDGALDTLFAAADRLARDADDRTGREDLSDLLPRLAPAAPPYGMSVATWARTIDAGHALDRPHRRRGVVVERHHRRRPGAAVARSPVRLVGRGSSWRGSGSSSARRTSTTTC